MKQLSFSLEDYMEEIYNQVLKTGQAKVTAIAETLGVRKASVTGALNVLSEKGLINYAPYSPVTLTQTGEKIAKEVLKKHENIAKFFVEVLNISQDDAVDIACKMEHIVSEKLFDNMMKLTKYAETNNLKNIYK